MSSDISGVSRRDDYGRTFFQRHAITVASLAFVVLMVFVVVAYLQASSQGAQQTRIITALSHALEVEQAGVKADGQTPQAPDAGTIIKDPGLAPTPLPGPSGPTGERGAPGPPGAAGPPGSTGVRGPSGAMGLPGAAGSVGLSGPAGSAGQPGRTGSAGLDGAAGAAGVDGVSGERGQDGASGRDGQEGAAGQPGPPGPQGSQGPQGPSGQPGDPGQSGAAGPACPAGYEQSPTILPTIGGVLLCVAVGDEPTPTPSDTAPATEPTGAP